jgi:hypothetical protein
VTSTRNQPIPSPPRWINRVASWLRCSSLKESFAGRRRYAAIICVLQRVSANGCSPLFFVIAADLTIGGGRCRARWRDPSSLSDVCLPLSSRQAPKPEASPFRWTMPEIRFFERRIRERFRGNDCRRSLTVHSECGQAKSSTRSRPFQGRLRLERYRQLGKCRTHNGGSVSLLSPRARPRYAEESRKDRGGGSGGTLGPWGLTGDDPERTRGASAGRGLMIEKPRGRTGTRSGRSLSSFRARARASLRTLGYPCRVYRECRWAHIHPSIHPSIHPCARASPLTRARHDVPFQRDVQCERGIARNNYKHRGSVDDQSSAAAAR